MRGNETEYRPESHGSQSVFSIPMRGNEFAATDATVPADRGFSIPMRGNETIGTAQENLGLGSFRSP